MKKVFYVIIALFVLYFVLALFGPKSVKAERSIVINAPVEVVHEKLGDFQYFHEKWSPWSQRDPNMKTTFTGVPGEPGHVYGWSGNKDVGVGELRLVRVSGDSIVQTLTFEGQGDAFAYYLVRDQGGQSHITWGMQFDVGYMMRTPMLFMNMDEMIGKDYEKGLARLKQVIESEERDNAAASI